MAVVWEDNFFDATKIKADTDVRITQRTDAGYIEGDDLVDSCEMGTAVIINAFFNIATTNTSAVANPGAEAVSGDNKVLLMTAPAAGGGNAIKGYVVGPNVVGGWDDAKVSVYLYVDDAVRNALVQTQFFASLRPKDTTLRYDMYVEVDTNVSNNFLVTKTPGGTTKVDSGIVVPTTDRWIKITIEYADERIYYSFEDAIYGTTAQSNVQPLARNMWFACYMGLNVNNTDVVQRLIYWDLFEIHSNLEQNDDTTNFPRHQHQFETVDINPANWATWLKFKLSKSNVSLTNEKFITVSVLDQNAAGAVISGFEDLTDDEIDLEGLTTDSISFLIKFWSVHSYESPILEKIELTYYVTGGEVTLAVTANTYNNDITTPITTKTGGYRITYEATAVAPDDPDVTIDYYWFDYGDGLNSGWITHNIVNHIYNKHSQNVSEAGADQEWNARVKVRDSNGNVSGWSNIIDVNVLNSAPMARLWAKPISVRMSGAGTGSALIQFFGDKSYDIDDNGFIRTSGGYKFDFGDGTAEAWQDDEYVSHPYTTAGVYIVGLTVRDDLNVESTKILQKINIKAKLAATTISFNRKPREATFDYTFDYQITKKVAGGLPDVEPIFGRNQILRIVGQAHLVETDITTLLGYANAHTLVSFEYVDLGGVTQTFTGYILSFRPRRAGGFNQDVPWTAIIQYKAV